MGKIKRLLAACLLLVLTLSLWAPMAKAAESTDPVPVLKVVDGSAPRGGVGTVTIRLEQNWSVCGGTFDIHYDPGQLNLQDAKPVGNALIQINRNLSPGTVRVTVAGAEKLPETMDILTLTFRVDNQAPLTGCPVTLEVIGMYDEAIQKVTSVTKAGLLRVHHALVRMETVEAVAGQAIQLRVFLEGELHPAGGSFTVQYPTEFLKSGAVFSGPMMQGSFLNSSEKEPGRIKVSWADSSPLTTTGVLCTLTFTVEEGASGSLPVKLLDVKLYDEKAEALDQQTQDGQIQLVAPVANSPKLWVVGGQLQENGQAQVAVVLEGEGQVCGGSFTLHYDPKLCTLLKVEPQISGSSVNSPLTGGDKASPPGEVKFAWAGAAASVSSQSLVILTFRAQEAGGQLKLNEVKAMDDRLQYLARVDIRNGKICPSGIGLQTPQIDSLEVRKSGNTAEVELCLDIARSELKPVEKDQPVRVLVSFYEDGRMKFTQFTVKASQLVFREGSFASLTLRADCQGMPDQFKVFLLDTSTAAPLSDAFVHFLPQT